MTHGEATASWRRACGRGAIIGLIVAAHAVLLVRVLMPAEPVARRARRAPMREATAIRVELLTPASTPVRHSAPVLTQRNAQPPRRTLHTVPVVATTPRATRPQPMRAFLAPAPASTPTSAPSFIAGGGLDARLRAVHRRPPTPKLPGGERYTVAEFAFVPPSQQTIAHKVHMIGDLFGRFDPVCKNTQYELAKPRLQQIADGYTTSQLERRLREHHCE